MDRQALLRFLGRRLVSVVFLIFGVTAVTFVITTQVPGDPALAVLGPDAIDDERAVEAFRQRYGLDQPLPVQYGRYVRNLARGDFGESQLTRRPVSRDLWRAFPATIELAVVAISLAVVCGVTFGVAAAMHRDRLIDRVLRVVSLAGVSMPVFWLAIVAFYFLSFRLGWFPGVGRLTPGLVPPPQVTGLYTVDAALAGQWDVYWDALRHTLLPGLVLASVSAGQLTRFTRSAVLEVVSMDYVRTASAKGLPGRIIVTRHILRAALVPVVTLLGLIFGTVLTGTVLVEQIFSWPGMGRYAFRSAINLDLPAIMGVAVVVAVLYITINFIVDVLYSIIDPRIRLG